MDTNPRPAVATFDQIEHLEPAVISPSYPASLSRWVHSSWKRAFDIVVSLLLLPFLLPILLLLACIVKMTSRGPILHVQDRLGLNGVLFPILKFRSMKHGRIEPGPALTQLNDPRLTGFGAWLRKWKLDELPQILNVLRGDMSLVGPRPHLPQLMRLHDEATVQVLRGRPGVTCTSAIAFRHEEELLEPLASDDLEEFYLSEIQPSKFELDLAYLRSASFLGDIKIILQTVVQIFSSPPKE